MEDAVYPDPFSRNLVRVGEAKRLIRHYREATSDIEGTAGLMLSFVEAGTEQAADLGYGEEAYFGALVRALEGVVDTLAKLSPDSRRDAVERIHEIADRAKSIGWGYCDSTQEIASRAKESLTSLQAPRAANVITLPGNEGKEPAQVRSTLYSRKQG